MGKLWLIAHLFSQSIFVKPLLCVRHFSSTTNIVNMRNKVHANEDSAVCKGRQTVEECL